jgi:GT2 family glycosyltransferase
LQARRLQLGGFDSDFFAYFEDVDLCWRAWLAGYRVALRPSSRVYHKLSATAGPLLRPERLFLGERNRLQCMLKNLGVWNLTVAIPVSCFYTLRRLLGFLRSRKPTAALAVLRGDWWVLTTHLPRIVTKRRRVQRSRRISDAFLSAHGLMASFGEGFREFARLAPLRTS